MDRRLFFRPYKKRISFHRESGLCVVFWVHCGFFSSGVRLEVSLDLRVSVLRRTSCVYRFPLHLLGLQSKCTEGIKQWGTGALGEVEQGTTDSC